MTAGFMLIMFLTVFVLTAVVNVYINDRFTDYIETEQEEAIETITTSLTYQYDSDTGAWNEDYIHGYGMYALSEGYILKVSDTEGNVIWDAEDHDMTTCHDIMEEIEILMEKNMPDLDGAFTDLQYDLTANGTKIGTVKITCYSPYHMDEHGFDFIEAFNNTIIIIGALAIILALIAGIIFARGITKPIKATVKTVGEISSGNYKTRIEEKSHTSSELASLTTAVNSMAKTLEGEENLRTRLVSDVAHELRTPLANIKSTIELINEGVWQATPERLKECQNEIDRLSALIGELEKLHEAEIENLNLKLEAVPLNTLFCKVKANFEASAKEKNIKVNIVAQDITALIDENKFTRVLNNLLSNAVKYSENGGEITLCAEKENNTAKITVKDRGIGIDEKDLPHIFERFYRTDTSRNRQTGGSGIGLSIAKAIVEAHGAKIFAESEKGHGTTFTITGLKLSE